MIILLLLMHIILMIVFATGIGISWAYHSLFGLIFFGVGLVMSVTSIFEDNLMEIKRSLKGRKHE